MRIIREVRIGEGQIYAGYTVALWTLVFLSVKTRRSVSLNYIILNPKSRVFNRVYFLFFSKNSSTTCEKIHRPEECLSQSMTRKNVNTVIAPEQKETPAAGSEKTGREQCYPERFRQNES